VVGQSLTDNAFMNQAVIGPSYCHLPQSSGVKTGDREGSVFYLNRARDDIIKVLRILSHSGAYIPSTDRTVNPAFAK